MKLKLLLISIFILNVAIAQVTKPLPTKQQWETYFFEKKAAIQAKLYNLALQGQIKAYCNDSLASYYTIGDLKKRGGKETIIPINDINSEWIKDSIAFEPLNANSISSIWFLKKIKSNPFSEIESNELKAISLTFKFTFGGIETHEIPLFWISISDLKLKLTEDEYNWLMLVYYYAKNDNTIRFIENSDDINYDKNWDINLYLYITHTMDSLFFKKLSTSLYLSHFYIQDFFYFSDTLNKYKAIIYDEQQKKKITLIQFSQKYYYEYYSPSCGCEGEINELECIEKDPYKIEYIESIYFANKSISTLFIQITDRITKFKNKFKIDIDDMRKHNGLPKNFWFFEDYYRSNP